MLRLCSSICFVHATFNKTMSHWTLMFQEKWINVPQILRIVLLKDFMRIQPSNIVPNIKKIWNFTLLFLCFLGNLYDFIICILVRIPIKTSIHDIRQRFPNCAHWGNTASSRGAAASSQVRREVQYLIEARHLAYLDKKPREKLKMYLLLIFIFYLRLT